MNKEYSHMYKKLTRVSFHLGAVCLLLAIFSVIAKQYIFLSIFSAIFIICLIVYLIFKKKYNDLLKSFMEKCPICKEKIHFEKKNKYLINNSEVNKTEYDLSYGDGISLMEINKYYCNDCKFCYSKIKTFVLNNNGKMVLFKENDNVDFEYENNY